MQFDLEFGDDGIFKLYKKDAPASAERKTAFDVMSLSNYYRDLNDVVALAADPPAKTLAFRRLKLLEVQANSFKHTTHSATQHAATRCHSFVQLH